MRKNVAKEKDTKRDQMTDKTPNKWNQIQNHNKRKTRNDLSGTNPLLAEPKYKVVGFGVA